MSPRNPQVREQPDLVRIHRTAQVITYATSFGVIAMFFAFDPDHRMARALLHAATAAFNLIVK